MSFNQSPLASFYVFYRVVEPPDAHDGGVAKGGCRRLS
jgi:hypothetical protein